MERTESTWPRILSWVVFPMGACCGKAAVDSDAAHPARRPQASTPADAEARVKAAEAASARHAAFEATAVGKAVKKSVLEAKRPAPALSPAAEAQQASNARDWLS